MVLCNAGLGLADIVNGQVGDALGGLSLGCWENRGLVRVVPRLLLIGKGSLGGLLAYPASVGGEVGSGMEGLPWLPVQLVAKSQLAIGARRQPQRASRLAPSLTVAMIAT